MANLAIREKMEAQRASFLASRRRLSQDFKVQRATGHLIQVVGGAAAGAVQAKVAPVGQIDPALIAGVLSIVAGEASGNPELTDLGSGMLTGLAALKSYEKMKS